jgi:hypothetical protein
MVFFIIALPFTAGDAKGEEAAGRFTVLASRFQPLFGVAQAEEKPDKPGCLIFGQHLPQP